MVTEPEVWYSYVKVSDLQGHLTIAVFSGVEEAKPGRKHVTSSIP